MSYFDESDFAIATLESEERAMTQNRKEKKEARALQRRTGWSYTRALYAVRNLNPEEIEKAVAERMKHLVDGKEAAKC